MGEIFGFLISLIPISLFASLGINMFAYYNVSTQHYDIKEKVVEIIRKGGLVTSSIGANINGLSPTSIPATFIYYSDILNIILTVFPANTLILRQK